MHSAMDEAKFIPSELILIQTADNNEMAELLPPKLYSFTSQTISFTCCNNPAMLQSSRSAILLKEILCLKALNKKEYLMILFFYFSSKAYILTPSLNRLVETVQIRGHNIWC